MMSSAPIPNDCAAFAKLCALATTGSLNREEWQELYSHLHGCSSCETLYQEYQALVSTEIATLAALQFDTPRMSTAAWNQEGARARLLDSLAVKRPPERTVSVEFNLPKMPGHAARSWRMVAGIAAAVVITITTAGVAYRIGVNKGRPYTSNPANPIIRDTSAVQEQLSQAISERNILDARMKARMDEIAALQRQTRATESELSKLEVAKRALESRNKELMTENSEQSNVLATMRKERAVLEQKLLEGEEQLRDVRQKLQYSESDRQKTLLRLTSLESQVDQLSAQVHQQQDVSKEQRNYLAADRDVRELMGARQLYIADVFDVDATGKNKKPFGRVFYTKGKSLIFYAFDLDQQPGYREASAFQVWGRPSASESSPVSLGIFYMDNEANRRWVLKADNPKILENINAVFVTVEPKGGSKKPTNRPFLLAYLHATPPNHP